MNLWKEDGVSSERLEADGGRGDALLALVELDVGRELQRLDVAAPAATPQRALAQHPRPPTVARLVRDVDRLPCRPLRRLVARKDPHLALLGQAKDLALARRHGAHEVLAREGALDALPAVARAPLEDVAAGVDCDAVRLGEGEVAEDEGREGGSGGGTLDGRGDRGGRGGRGDAVRVAAPAARMKHSSATELHGLI